MLVPLVLGVALIAGVVYLVMQPGAKAPAPSPYTPPPAAPPMRAVTAWLAQIARTDPGFNEAEFLGRAQMVFLALQKAWQDRDVSECRPFLDEGLYTEWASEIGEMLAERHRHVRDHMQLEEMQIVEAMQQGGLDTVTVWFRGVSSDYTMDDNTGTIISAGGWGKFFGECWTFIRKTGVKTLQVGGIIEHKCPSCGAPISLNEVGACAYCHATVTTGDFDWVVSAITAAPPPAYNANDASMTLEGISFNV